jgi:prepilin-type N-terminal cleavage/methylation domain-containing protein
MSPLFHSKSQQFGFTLVEMLVVIAINTLLLAAIMGAVTQIYKNNSYTFEQANEIEAARRSIGIWVRDAREMTLGADGSYPVAVLQNNKMGFYSDIDRDSNVEYVEYELSTTTLTKKTYNPVGNPPVYSTTTPDSTEILSTYVQNNTQGVPVFTYYSATGTVLASPSAMLTDMRYVIMKVIVNVDPNRSPGEFMLHASAAPRNIKDNL